MPEEEGRRTKGGDDGDAGVEGVARSEFEYS